MKIERFSYLLTPYVSNYTQAKERIRNMYPTAKVVEISRKNNYVRIDGETFNGIDLKTFNTIINGIVNVRNVKIINWGLIKDIRKYLNDN